MRKPNLTDVTWIEIEPYLLSLEDRFGIPPAVFNDYVFYQKGRKYFYILPANHQPPTKPNIISAGQPFLNIGPKVPKLTSIAATTFGKFVTKNIIVASKKQQEAFVRRKSFKLSAGQIEKCSGYGYVLIRYQNITIGNGFYRENEGLCESFFPKTWAYK